VLRRWDDPAIGGKQNKEWGDAWMKRYAAQRAASEQQFEHNVNQLNKTYLDTSNRNFQAQQEGYRRQAAVQQQMHNEFMDAMQQGTDRSMQRTADAMQARSTSTSDWVDYALDRQTVRDVNTGRPARYRTRSLQVDIAKSAWRRNTVLTEESSGLEENSKAGYHHPNQIAAKERMVMESRRWLADLELAQFWWR